MDFMRIIVVPPIIYFAIIQIKRILFILPISILLLSCVSRLRRPELSGTIMDYDKNPIEGCAVGKTSTDRNGKFSLSELEYEFLELNRK
ncbi:Uncharacterized protein AAY48_4057 [Leptospira interrogans serovar Muenchen]|nr:Uncharacterized protein AAY48_4057 [Leptospira interrogans serovar Muenchen]